MIVATGRSYEAKERAERLSPLHRAQEAIFKVQQVN
jgi:hypothetical protein